MGQGTVIESMNNKLETEIEKKEEKKFIEI